MRLAFSTTTMYDALIHGSIDQQVEEPGRMVIVSLLAHMKSCAPTFPVQSQVHVEGAWVDDHMRPSA